ncbi:MAG: anthranilate synthase component I, partial [candidate division WS1 bacterium]|nr:anthranilate synthase component I [candidate division WS1 bacterium]
PVSAFLKLQAGSNGYAFLLESVAGGENIARYSYLATAPYQVFASKEREVTITRGERVEKTALPEGQDPLDVLAGLLKEYRFVPLPGWERFAGGAVGYLGYDLVRFFEELPEENPDDLGLPDCQLMFADTMVVFDHVMHRARVVTNAHVTGDPQAAYWEALKRIDAVVEQLRKPLGSATPVASRESRVASAAPTPGGAAGGEGQGELGKGGSAVGPRLRRVPADPTALPSTMTRAQHEAAVLKAKEYIAAGDIIQVVLSHRMQAQVEVAPFDLYRALRAINPSPYMFYLSFGDLKIIGASPEILVTEDRGEVVTRPIAGTRRRGQTEEEDQALEQELLADAKERAEHIMLVDLHRNDLGRVCVPGTVQVDELMVVERYSHVMHLVSNVRGKLAPEKDQFDLLRATFPAGTLSGAPKIRAMEIIEELEPVRRGPYGGAIGYFSFSGSMDTAITLRTMVMKGDRVYIQAGGGIVADSEPAKEYQETLMKAGALLDALRFAEEGLL